MQYNLGVFPIFSTIRIHKLTYNYKLNTMKHFILKVTTIFSIFFLFSCASNDDDNTLPTSQNGITISGTFFPTPNAYLILDKGTTPFENSFFFGLSNGTLINDANDAVFSSNNTTVATALLIDHGGTVASHNLVDVNASTYFMDKDDSVAITNITSFTNTYMAGGITYGEIDQDTATDYKIKNSGSGSFTITAITKNFTTRTGTITCSFTMTDDNGVLISGSYSGTYTMLNGDV